MMFRDEQTGECLSRTSKPKEENKSREKIERADEWVR